jgi:hypothetical protein
VGVTIQLLPEAREFRCGVAGQPEPPLHIKQVGFFGSAAGSGDQISEPWQHAEGIGELRLR